MNQSHWLSCYAFDSSPDNTLSISAVPGAVRPPGPGVGISLDEGKLERYRMH